MKYCNHHSIIITVNVKWCRHFWISLLHMLQENLLNGTDIVLVGAVIVV